MIFGIYFFNLRERISYRLRAPFTAKRIRVSMATELTETQSLMFMATFLLEAVKDPSFEAKQDDGEDMAKGLQMLGERLTSQGIGSLESFINHEKGTYKDQGNLLFFFFLVVVSCSVVF